MPSCVVKSCKNYTRKLKKSQGITYHAFPRNKNRKDDWVLIIRNCRGENNWNPSSVSKVCSVHFDDVDFITTAKGLRCLVPYAIPKRFLSNPPETQSTSSPILQMSPNVKGVANDQQPPSSPSTTSSLLQVPVPPDNFALTGYCRLCAASNCDSKLINVQSDNVLKKLIVDMSNRLNTNIDFSQEHLPTTICSECVKSLYTAYDFVVGIDLAQMTLNKISMQKYKYQMPDFFDLGNKMEQVSPHIGAAESNFEQSLSFMSNMTTPISMVSSNIKVEVNDFDQPDVSSTIITPLQQLSPKPNTGSTMSNFEMSLPFMSNMTTPVPMLSPNTGAAQNYFEQPPLLESSLWLDSTRNRRLKDNLNKKRQIIEHQKKNLKRLNQKVRRLQNRNESLKNIMKNLKEGNYI